MTMITIWNDEAESGQAIEVRQVDSVEQSIIDHRDVHPGGTVQMELHAGAMILIEEIDE